MTPAITPTGDPRNWNSPIDKKNYSVSYFLQIFPMDMAPVHMLSNMIDSFFDFNNLIVA